VTLYEGANRCLRVYALDSPLADEITGPDAVVSLAESASGWVFLKGETQVCNRDDLAAISSPVVKRMLGTGNSIVLLHSPDHSKGQAGDPKLGRASEHAFAPQDISFSKQVAARAYAKSANSRTN
jgi:hypothetical protein